MPAGVLSFLTTCLWIPHAEERATSVLRSPGTNFHENIQLSVRFGRTNPISKDDGWLTRPRAVHVRTPHRTTRAGCVRWALPPPAVFTIKVSRKTPVDVNL